MNDQDRNTLADLLEQWGVPPTEARDWAWEVETRVAFLRDVLTTAGRSTLVLGISGGVDSLVAGRLCQLAAESLRAAQRPGRFIAVRLPYGRQADETDAAAALAFIRPDTTMTVDIKPGVDALHDAVLSGQSEVPESRADFERGNVKARARMTAQYEIAALNDGLVVGTDHNAEAVTGFFTKWGDGACDLLPLRGLNKRQVRKLARVLGADNALADKPATADLESLQPLRTDEEALGLPYELIDDVLEGKGGQEADVTRLVGIYRRTAHKRQDPPAADEYQKTIRQGG